MERLHAAWILFWALLKTLIGPIFGARRGVAAFRASYARDRLPAVAPDERRALPAFGGCIACGRCDVGEAARAVASRGVYAGVMDLVVASSRSMPDFDAAARSFDVVDDARLTELEKVCPTAVPMRAIKAFVRQKAAEVGPVAPEEA